MSGRDISARLRHRVTIDRRVEVRDPSTGFASTTWENVRDAVAAEVLTGPGRESEARGQTQNEIAARITVRWHSALRNPTGLRIRHAFDTYHVETASYDATGCRSITFVCSTGAGRDDG